MTDFLDRLEADLRVAAENRGRRRRPRPRPAPALKVLAAAAAIALLVFGIARVADRNADVRPAAPTPTPPPASAFALNDKDIAVATGGDPGTLDLLEDRLDHAWLVDAGRKRAPHTADPALGTVVLYRAGSEQLADAVAATADIGRKEVLTPSLSEQLHFDHDEARVVVVFGTDYEQRALAKCQLAGHIAAGELTLCPEGDGTAFVVDGKRLPVDPLPIGGAYSWAAASPDGKTILAEWRGACAMPRAVLIPVASGRSRALTEDASRAMGWTTDGRAIVFHYVGDRCEPGNEAALQLVEPDGRPITLGKAARLDLPRSINPREIKEIIGAA